jgi:formate-nitrite transporter family protein
MPATPLTSALSAADHVDGPDGAEMELVMYGDFQCPYCAAAFPIVKRIRGQLGERLRFAFRHFPLRELHPLAEGAAQASEAAAEQGAFWPMHDRLYEARGKLEVPSLMSYAGELGLDGERIAEQLASGVHAQRVQRDVDSGLASGVRGTPGFFTNGVLHEGAFDAGSLLGALEDSAAAPRA